MKSRSKDPLQYQSRDYRHKIDSKGLATMEVKVRETDLFIAADSSDAYDSALRSTLKYRNYIEEYIKIRPEFFTSLNPIQDDSLAPDIIKEMIRATRIAQVGPMAAVAGALSEFVGYDLLKTSREVVVENGGDIFMKRDKDSCAGVFAGESPFSNRLSLKISAEMMPAGICTSSGTIGHSLSLGRADAVCIISKSAVLADAAATAVGNRVGSEKDIKQAIEFGSGLKGVDGILIVVGDRMGAWGAIDLA